MVGVAGTSEVVEDVIVGRRAGVKGRREKDEGGNEGVEMAARFSSTPGDGGTTSERRLALRVFLASRFGRWSEKECEVGRVIGGMGASVTNSGAGGSYEGMMWI